MNSLPVSMLGRCRFLESIPKVQTAVTMLEEADGRFIKKQRGIISDNTMMLERASTKLTYDCPSLLCTAPPCSACLGLHAWGLLRARLWDVLLSGFLL